MGDVIKIGESAESYIVDSKQMTIDAAGTMTAVVTLKSNRKWFEGLDAFAGRHDDILVVFGVIFMLVELAATAAFFLLLSMPTETKLAYAGDAIFHAPWALFFGIVIGISMLSKRLVSKIGYTLSFAGGFSGATLGAIMAVIWADLFIPKPPKLWPTDYIQLATDFWKSTSAMVAVAAAYAPVIFLVIKLFKFDVVGTIVSTVLGRKIPD